MNSNERCEVKDFCAKTKAFRPEVKVFTHYLVIGETIKLGMEKQPNSFHRLMHRIFFGFKYEKIN